MIFEKRNVLLLTDHRILYCEKNDIFGGWQVSFHFHLNAAQMYIIIIIVFQVEWTYRWGEINMFRIVEKGVELIIGEKTKKVLGIFGSSEQLKKLILMHQKAKRERLLAIMDKLKQEAK